jgi:hypothetical protein
MEKKPSVRDLRHQIQRLKWSVDRDERVLKVISIVKAEIAPKIKALEDQISAIVEKRPKPKPRWPENTPQNVIKKAEKEFEGSTQYHSFRIHCWNDKAFWVSWPSGGYYSLSGWHPTPATFILLSMTKEENKFGKSAPVRLKSVDGRLSQKSMQEELDKL